MGRRIEDLFVSSDLDRSEWLADIEHGVFISLLYGLC